MIEVNQKFKMSTVPCRSMPLDQLPQLCLEKIFKSLSVPDLVRCRAVNRQFKVYADQAAVWVNKLVVNEENWKNSISQKAFSSLKSSPFKLNHLKFLNIDLQLISGPNYKMINSFKQLIHLKIKCWQSRKQKPVPLLLPNLRVFETRSDSEADYLLILACGLHPARYILKTPKLEELACEGLQRVCVEHPETVKRIKCEYKPEDWYDPGPVERLEESLEQFENLVSLKVFLQSRDLYRFDIRLSNWKHLKELNFDLKFSFEDEYEYLSFKEWLDRILKQRTALKRDELKVYLAKVQLLKASQLPDWRAWIVDRPMKDDDEDMPHDQSDLAEYYFWIKNYRLLTDEPRRWVGEIDFNVLLNLNFQLSTDFFRRFNTIHHLTATGRVNRADIEWFLQHATAVRHLSLTNTSLDQSFADGLHKLNSQLNHLEVNEKAITDFRFIQQFKQLYDFKTDQQLTSLQVVIDTFWEVDEFEYFNSRTDCESVEFSWASREDVTYSLRFSTIKNNNVKFSCENVDWDDLIDAYEERCRTVKLEKRLRIKRSD